VPEPILKPLCALGDYQPHTENYSGVSIRENPDFAMASVAIRMGRDADFAPKAATLFGMALPGPGDMSGAGDWSAFWTGPGQWMVTAPYASHEDISRIVKTGLSDTASVTEQTDGWVRFDIEGPRAMDMFERLSNVDVRTMKAGQATRTQVEHLGSFLLCHSAAMRFSLITLRSGADSMHHALMTAAKSLG